MIRGAGLGVAVWQGAGDLFLSLHPASSGHTVSSAVRSGSSDPDLSAGLKE